jgi:anaerobic magnesium-protoporphyrin IX monomethyl ester cyclase
MEQIKRTISFAHGLKLDFFIPFIYNPLPGSPLWKVCVDGGYIPEDYQYEEANNYFQSDLTTANFNAEQLAKIQARAYARMVLTLPFRNPRVFISYYSRLFLTRPDFLRTFFKHISKAGK